MKFISYDVETEVIHEGCGFPRIVCHAEAQAGLAPEVHLRAASVSRLAMHLSLGHTIIAHNASFDMGCAIEDDFALNEGHLGLLQIVWDAYREGRIRCTKMRERLIDIAKGTLRSNKGYYTLNEISQRRIGRTLNKGEDSWRLRYGLLAGVPLEKWPAEALQYVLDDADTTLSVFWQQATEWEGSPEPHLCVPAYRDEEAFQAELDFVFRLMEAWGVRADAKRAEELAADLRSRRDVYQSELLQIGFLKPKWKGRGSAKHVVGYSKDMATIRQRIMVAYNRLHETVPSTGPTSKHPNGQIQTSREVCEDADDEFLLKLADRDRFDKILQFVPVLQRGAQIPYGPPWNTLGANTARTSCGDEDNPGNLQQPPRDFNVREIIVPREGFWFGGADLSGAELCGLAEMCWTWFGVSKMRETLNAGRDLHSALAASILNMTYDAFIAELKDEKASGIGESGRCQKARDGAKNSNFGFAGGMGAEKFIKTMRKKNITMTLQEAEFLKRAWLNMWSEMRLYFERATQVADIGYDQHYKSGRLRGGLNFTTAANGPFQGLIADWAKDWLREVARECYLVPSSALYGSRPVLFLHDEIIVETPAVQPGANNAVRRLAELGVEVGKRWIPNVLARSDGVLMKRWYKGAKQVIDANGLIQPWAPPPPKEKKGTAA